METKNILECPFCGAKPVNKEEFVRRTGIEIERTIKWNGEASIILRLGELVMEGQKRTGQDTLDKQKILDLLKEEYKRIDERQKELEENRKNIVEEQKGTFEELTKQRKELEENRKNVAKEQKEAFEEIAKRKKELEDKNEQIEEETTKQMKEIMAEKEELHELKEEVLKAEQIKMPEEVMRLIKELQKEFNTPITEMKDLLTKAVHNVKSSGTLQEMLLLRRLKALNTGDKIEHLGGPDQEDVLVTVMDSGKELGKIRIDSKKVEKWDSKFVEKMAKYLKEDDMDFGIIATTAMPKNAAGSDFHWEENILVVNAAVVECTYLVSRYLIRKSNQYTGEQEKRLNLLEKDEKKFQAVRDILENSSTKKFLTAICQEVAKSNKTLDDFDKYTQKAIKGLGKCNMNIVKQVNTALDSNEELQKALSGA